MGRNGAGKSTLLRIISGVLQPTTGAVEVNGRLTAIFGLGSGFNPEFTGRENAMLNGLILGIDRQEMLERFDDIAAFADIGEFMDQPVKTYSSGMKSRLGFAVAVNVDPDILVLDEALSAGDAAFKKKTLQRMYDLRDSGTTVLFVSHSMGMVKQFCTDAILLHKGRLVTSGSPDEVADHYKELLEKAVQKDSQTDGTDRGLDDMLDQRGGRGSRGCGLQGRLRTPWRGCERSRDPDRRGARREGGAGQHRALGVHGNRPGARALRGGRGGERPGHYPAKQEGRGGRVLD